jgi:hypothetical protein
LASGAGLATTAAVGPVASRVNASLAALDGGRLALFLLLFLLFRLQPRVVLVLLPAPPLVPLPLCALGDIQLAGQPGERRNQHRSQLGNGAARCSLRQESSHKVKLVAMHEGSHSGEGGFS